MKKILITGGAGFIGTNFIYYILNKYLDYKVVNLDILSYAGNLDNLKPIKYHENYKFIKGDISDRKFIFDLFEEERFDMVVNFAAESHVDRSISNPNIFIQTNVVGTQVLLDASREHKVNRFHQVSTDEVYGDLPTDNKNLLFTEETNLNPSSPYSASKASADLLVMAYYKTFKLPISISRCSNNYGPYQFPEKLIPLVINRALKNESIPVYGTGLNIRDWIHVYDHCSAIDLILHKGEVGQVYNVGSNNEKTNIELVKKILKTLGRNDNLIKYVNDRPGHDLRYAIDSSKISKALGWKPHYNFEEGIKETIGWYLDNKDWMENIISGEYKNYYKGQYGNI